MEISLVQQSRRNRMEIVYPAEENRVVRVPLA
jgi:hypothetical protein